MQVVLSFALPLATLVLVAVGAWEVRPRRKPSRLKRRLSSTYLDEVTAFLYGTKRTELDHRDSVEMTLEEQAQGAPPLGAIDLDRGVVVLRPDDQDERPGKAAPAGLGAVVCRGPGSRSHRAPQCAWASPREPV